MRIPLVVVTGIDVDVMDRIMVGVPWDLPRVVTVRHYIQPETQILTRIVSDAGGVVERHATTLEHACVTCALREDILPTLERLARDGRWGSIVACLPAGAEAEHLGHVLAGATWLSRFLRLHCVVTGLPADDPAGDLLGPALLQDHGLHISPDDDRGIGEVGCAMVEYADIVVFAADPGPDAVDLVRALARRDALVVAGSEYLDGGLLTGARHVEKRSKAWRSPIFGSGAMPPALGRAWRLDLASPKPFHPQRLLDDIERLGAGRHRSRGCFWVPTRPGVVQQWEGAGGRLEGGSHSAWGRRAPLTRLVFTGLGAPPADLVTAFEDVLLTPDEMRFDPRYWTVAEDGLEPWLGDIERAA